MLIVQSISTRVGIAGVPALPQLKAGTLQAFERYVKLTEARNEAELKRETNLLWVDALPTDQRAEAYAALKRGEAIRSVVMFD